MIVLCCIMLKQENIDSVFGFMRSDGTWNYGIITWSKYILLIGFPWCKVKSVYKKPHPSAASSPTARRLRNSARRNISSVWPGPYIWGFCSIWTDRNSRRCRANIYNCGGRRGGFCGRPVRRRDSLQDRKVSFAFLKKYDIILTQKSNVPVFIYMNVKCGNDNQRVWLAGI